MTRADRLDLLRRARVPLWRGCVLTGGVVLAGPIDDPRWCAVPYWTGWRNREQWRLDIVVDDVGPIWRDGVEAVLIDPDAPENFPHLLAELARREGLDPSRGVLLTWMSGRWWLETQGHTVPGAAELGHPEIPDTPEGCIDVVCLALSETAAKE